MPQFLSPGLFRLLLASIVVFGHFNRFNFGFQAVMLFFVLSGYWITIMWRHRYAGCRAPYLTFIVSRLWRLLPVFLLASGIMLVFLAPPPAEWRAWVADLAILGSASVDESRLVLVPAWSLDIEVQFYALAPLLLALLGWRAAQWLLLAVAGALVLGCIDRSGIGGYVPGYTLFFLLGVLAAQRNWMPAPRLVAGAGALGLVAAAASASGRLAAYPLADHLAAAGTALCFTPLALATVRNRSRGFDKCLGDLSYVVYLLHWPAAVIARSYAQLPFAERLPLCAALVATAYGASLLVWWTFDRPLNRRRERFVRGRLPAAPAAPNAPRRHGGFAAVPARQPG